MKEFCKCDTCSFINIEENTSYFDPTLAIKILCACMSVRFALLGELSDSETKNHHYLRIEDNLDNMKIVYKP